MVTYTTQIQALYVAYFGRPADVDGLNHLAETLGAKVGTQSIKEMNLIEAEPVKRQPTWVDQPWLRDSRKRRK